MLVFARHGGGESESGTRDGCGLGDPEGDVGGSGADVRKILEGKVGSEREGYAFVFVHMVKRGRPVLVDAKPGTVAERVALGP